MPNESTEREPIMKLPSPSSSTSEFIVPDAGVYKMEFTDYGEPVLGTFKKANGEDAYRIKLVFTIRDEESEFDGADIYAWYGWSMHPKAKLYPIVKALVGGEIADDDEPDLDELIGKFIMGTLDVVTKDSETGKRTYANLIAASPVRKKKIVKPAPPPVVVLEGDEDDDDDPFADEFDAA
jgi:hypothetical protein